MEEVNKNTEVDNTDKKLHISDVIPRYKFSSCHTEDNMNDWIIIDTHEDKIVETIKNVELHEVRQRCREWNNNVV